MTGRNEFPTRRSSSVTAKIVELARIRKYLAGVLAHLVGLIRLAAVPGVAIDVETADKDRRRAVQAAIALQTLSHERFAWSCFDGEVEWWDPNWDYNQDGRMSLPMTNDCVDIITDNNQCTPDVTRVDYEIADALRAECESPVLATA